jgi:hypothetical protein
MTRFNRLDDLSDLNEAIMLYKRNASLLTDSDYQKALWMNNLGIAQKKLFLKSENIADLNDAISALNDASCLCPDGHPQRAKFLANFAAAVLLRYSQFGDENDYEKAITAFTSAVYSRNAPASVRFKTAVLWARLPQANKFKESVGGPGLRWNEFERLMKLDSESLEFRQFVGNRSESWGASRGDLGILVEGWSESIPAFTAALDILPELSWLGLSIRDRHYHIVAAGEVVREAVGTAINAHEYGRAVEWLEQGRSIIWGQILELRTPVDALKQSHPDLAEKLLLFSTQLEGAGTRDISLHWELLQLAGDRYHEVAHARDLLLKEIRALPKFSRFLLPKTMSEISLAAEHGPVVILNVSLWQTAALVLMPGFVEEILYIPLPEFHIERIDALEKSLRGLVWEGRGMKREGRMPPEAEFADILSELWKRVAKPILEGIGYSVS